MVEEVGETVSGEGDLAFADGVAAVEVLLGGDVVFMDPLVGGVDGDVEAAFGPGPGIGDGEVFLEGGSRVLLRDLLAQAFVIVDRVLAEGLAMNGRAYTVLVGDLHHRLVPESMQVFRDGTGVDREAISTGVALGLGRGASSRDVERLVHVADHVDEEAEHQRLLELPVEVVGVLSMRLQGLEGLDL